MGFVFQNETDLAKQIQLLNEALAYLNKSKEKSIESLLGEQDAYEAFFYVAYACAFYLSRIDKDEFANKNLEQVMGNTLMHLYKINEQFEFVKNKSSSIVLPSNKLPNKELTYQQKCVEIFCYIHYCMNLIGSGSWVILNV